MGNAEKLKEWRDGLGLSQAEAARRIDSTQGAWGPWERGGKAPDLHNALAIERLTGGAVPAVGWARRKAKPMKSSRAKRRRARRSTPASAAA